MIDLPGSPKLADLTAAVLEIDGRIDALERTVNANRARLEGRARTAIEGLRQTQGRDRWLATLRRR